MKKKVLVIDDNPHILEAVELILTTEDYDVHSRTDITDIVTYTTKLHPSVILLDLLLSGKSGQDAASL
ncbi:MAG TPA: response regulator, partial [Clostridia bacterium]